MNELPTNVSDDVRRLNPGVFGKAMDFVNNAVRSEIEYAKAHNKIITYLEPTPPEGR